MTQCCDIPLEWGLVSPSWSAYPVEAATCPHCLTEYKRKSGSVITYVFVKENFVCTTCNGNILEKKVGPDESTPYCPKCEKEPAPKGADTRSSTARS